MYEIDKMTERKEVADRKKEVVGVCLDTFVARWLSETTVLDLSKALKLKASALYWYFRNKDEAVLACASEALSRLEYDLYAPAIKEIDQPHYMIKRLLSRANETAPTMRFLAQVYSTPKYRANMESTMNSISKQYNFYSSKIADRLRCNSSDVEVCVSVLVSVITNYMIFGETSNIRPQLVIVEKQFVKLLEDSN